MRRMNRVRRIRTHAPRRLPRQRPSVVGMGAPNGNKAGQFIEYVTESGYFTTLHLLRAEQ